MSIFESIKEEFNIPHAFHDWKLYRDRLTDIILHENNDNEKMHKGTESKISTLKTCGSDKKHGSIAILGAGPCNDIDLKRLCEKYENVSLIDIDTESIGVGVTRQGVDKYPGINIVKASISGISEEMTESFFKRMYLYVCEKGQNLTEKDFIGRSIEELSIVEQHLYKSPADLRKVIPPKSVDTIVAAGLHSQLWSILSYCWHVLAGNVSEQLFSGRPVDPEPFHDHIRELDDRFIPILNSWILESSRDRAVFASEYDPNFPSEGAWQCIRDLRKRYTSGEIYLQEFTLLWPFNPEQRKQYTMLIQDVKK